MNTRKDLARDIAGLLEEDSDGLVWVSRTMTNDLVVDDVKDLNRMALDRKDEMIYNLIVNLRKELK